MSLPPAKRAAASAESANLDQFLDDLFLQGIVLQAEGENLQLRGAKGVLTPNTIARLKTHKGAILRKLTEPVARYPLSYGQEALWYTAQNAADSPLYNVSIALRIHSAVDLVALQRTFQAFVIRHPLLRTTFAQANGKPEQVVQRFQEVTLNQIAATGWDEATFDARVLAIHEQPFDLTQGPLLRVTLFTRNDTEHLLLCTMHHIVTDGWSLWMLLDEFRQLYPIAQREPLTLATLATLPRASRSYADYVAWQQQMVTAEGDKLWRYWEQQLAGELPVLDLPTDRPRPRVQSYRGASHHFTLADVTTATGSAATNGAPAGAILSRQLRQLAQQEGTTLYTLLLAAFQVLLHRYSGQDEILVGSPTAGRSQPEFAPIFGYFTSPVVLRGKLADNPTFLDFLGQMRTTVLEALSHQDFPFGLLVNRLQQRREQTGRDSSRPPLYQATFALQKPQQTGHILNSAAAGESSRMAWGGLTVSPYELGQYQGRVDILLEMFEGSEEITATLRYSTDLFDAATIEQMATHFVTLLQAIVERPQQPIAHLPLLSTTAQQALIDAGRGPTVSYPTDRAVHQRFADQAARTPDADALIFLQNQATAEPRRRLSYRELNEQANQLAHYLRTCGVGHTEDTEPLVGICLDRSPEMVISILAVLKAGGAYVPLDPAYPPQRMAFIMADAALGWILTRDALAANLPESSATLLRWEAIAPAVATQPTTNPASQEQTTAEQLAYVIYTSGSTGQPKGVMVEHRGIPNLAYAQMTAFGVTAKSRVLQFASFSFDASVSELFKTLLAGATLYMADRDTLLPGPDLIELFKREAITMVTLPPSVLAALPVAELPALQSLIVAGEVCPVELAQRWAPGRRFLNAYGPTEATVCATVEELTPEAIAATPRALSIGQPIANVEVYLLDQYQQPVPVGVPGELYIGGIGVARGYLNRPDLTAEKFLTNPFSHASEPGRLYRTGDRARYLPTAEAGRFQIEFLGRIDNQVKLRGFRIELGEIEAVLLQHAAVREAAVIVHTDDTAQQSHQQLVAYVAPEASTGEVEGEHISYWQDVNTQIFGNAPEPQDRSFNITGWGNSYTGLPFADVEMQEWVENTVAAILALQPKRVLEIGCGTGLLLTRIAPHCEQYVGADFSPEVLENIRQLQAVNPALSHVTLEERTADNLAGLETGDFDLVILNSVIQYFPTIDYLRRVLHGAVDLLHVGGKIFVGDVRSLPHLSAYHATVQLTSADNDLTRAELAQQVQRTMQEEEELVVDPRFFVALSNDLPQLADVEIQLKRGTHVNELLQFRYSAILHVEAGRGSGDQHQKSLDDADIVWLDWEQDALSLARLQQFLTAEQPPLLAVRHVPNRRVQKATKIADWLTAEHEQTVGDLLPQLTNQADTQSALDPEAVWALGAACGYVVDITWSELGAYRNGMDLLFKRPEVTASVSLLYHQQAATAPSAWSTYANSPLQGTLRRKLAPQLHDYLNNRLPGYMVPNTLILLDALPLNNSGKVDRRALPAPTLQRSVKGFTPPTTALEKKLAAVWCEILGVDRVSIHDDFFDLGGNSLLMVQLTSGMSAALAEQIGAKELMLNPTIAQFAQSYEKRTATAAAQSALPATNGTAANGTTATNGAAPTINGMALPEAPHIRWESRSLLSLFVTGKLPPIDVAAVAYLSSTAMKKSGLSRDEVVYEHFENLPLMSTIMETAWGRIGLITIPRLGSELYQDEEAMDLILEGLQMAGRFGAKVVSLTGLIPSATDYGNAILAAANGQGDLPQVTTGHATTSAAVLLSAQRLLQEAKREIQNETVGFIGLGSVGMATLHTMLRALPHPKALILCDLFSKAAALEETRRELIDRYDYQGEIRVATSHAEAPDAIYAATLIVGATNVPDVLEIGRVQPGTLLVDDSAPHCFDVQQAIQRLEAQEDILFTEGGVLELPEPIHYHVHAARALAPMVKDTRLFKETEATGCVISSLLAARYPELPPTVGLVNPHAGADHYAKLQELGIRAAALHCRDYHLPKRVIRSFRYRFGGK